MENIPDRIYLQIRDGVNINSKCEDFKKLTGVTWSHIKFRRTDIPYIRDEWIPVDVNNLPEGNVISSNGKEIRIGKLYSCLGGTTVKCEYAYSFELFDITHFRPLFELPKTK